MTDFKSHFINVEFMLAGKTKMTSIILDRQPPTIWAGLSASIYQGGFDFRSVPIEMATALLTMKIDIVKIVHQFAAFAIHEKMWPTRSIFHRRPGYRGLPRSVYLRNFSMASRKTMMPAMMATFRMKTIISTISSCVVLLMNDISQPPFHTW